MKNKEFKETAEDIIRLLHHAKEILIELRKKHEKAVKERAFNKARIL